MGRFGFSWTGAVFLLALFLPNVVWAIRDRRKDVAGGESRVLVVLERVGQVATTACALLFDDTNPRPWTPWTLWLVAAVALMVLYEASWVRWFRSPRRPADLYRPLWLVPVPLALLPCVAFILLGAYGRLWPLIASAVVLSVGHVGIHLRHAAALERASA